VEGNWNRPPTNFGLKVALPLPLVGKTSCRLAPATDALQQIRELKAPECGICGIQMMNNKNFY